MHVPYADAMLVPLPDGVDAAALASASDNLPDAWRTVGPHLAARPGAPIAIVGGGAPSIGLYAVATARALGAGQVDYVDTDPQRLRLAERLDATPIQGPAPKRLPRRYPITVDASAQPAGLACALRSTEPGGVCTSVGIYFAPQTPVPLLEMFTTGLTFITGRPNVRVVIPEVLDLVAGGRIHPEQVTSKVVAWDDAPTALVELPGPTKLVVAHKTQGGR